MLCQHRLKQCLFYNETTGLFTWRIHFQTKHRKDNRVGSVAGSLSKAGYIYITIDGNTYLAHRLAWLYMKGEWPIFQVFHENKIKNDNSWKNLTQGTIQERIEKASPQKLPSSGVIGIYYNKKADRYTVRGLSGTFKTLKEALNAKEACI